MEVIFGSLILVSFGSILFTTIESININYTFSNMYKNIVADMVRVSRLKKGFNGLMISQIFLLFLQILFIFNFILIVEPYNYNFIIFPYPQLGCLIIIIVLFFLSTILMIIAKTISNSLKMEVLNEIDSMNPKHIKLFLEYLEKTKGNKNGKK